MKCNKRKYQNSLDKYAVSSRNTENIMMMFAPSPHKCKWLSPFIFTLLHTHVGKSQPPTNSLH